MPEILFRGVAIRYINLRRKNGGYVDIHLKSDYSDTVAAKMGWPLKFDPAIGSPIPLESYLPLGGLKIVPVDPGLQSLGFQCTASEGFKFEFHRLAPKEEGGPVESFLHFIVRTTDKGSVAFLWNYWDAIADALSELRLDCVGGEQTKLFDQVQEPEPETEPEPTITGPVLASAREVTGTSRPHLAGRRKRRGGDVVAEETGEVILTGAAAEMHANATQRRPAARGEHRWPRK